MNLEKQKMLKAERQLKARNLGAIIEHYLKYYLCKQVKEATKDELFTALALAVREIAADGMFNTASLHENRDPKRVYYLSLEYLIGRSLENNLHNLGLYDLLDDIDIGNTIPFRDVLDAEYDPALGNGGLGRLAACFMDSMATLGLPGYGYGINYQFGLFKQYLENGWQKEKADSWFINSSPWQIERADRTCGVPIYGRIENVSKAGKQVSYWVDTDGILGIPYDMPVVGYGGKTVNYLRLFSARSNDELDIKTFNEGGYIKAVERKIKTETVSKVLYPSDSNESGKELRLVQQYFFVSCSITDILRRFLEHHIDFNLLPQKVAIQMNDTHPALAVVELMRVLIDNYNVPWDKAWDITVKTFGYTNHTLLPEALEKWSVPLIEKVIPRHMQIIYLINMNLMNEIAKKYPNDVGKLQRMSIIEEGDVKKVRMANLAIYASHSVNGVAALHSELIKTNLVPDFYQMWPERFNNKTNGITPRRWLLSANTPLADLISSKIGDGWITDLYQLKKLEKYLDDENFKREFGEIKYENKKLLAQIIEIKTRVKIDTNSMFDVQAKRFHEYKRQLLNALNIIHQYFAIVQDNKIPPVAKTYIFAGKAAPSYDMAKLIIKLINNIAIVVNEDKKASKYMKVVFIPDYKVSLAERIFPAADLSEQISTAGFEASGTGNMKFVLNGAVTIGTLDGANIEIREEVGDDNFYLFGLTAEQVFDLKKSKRYNPWNYYNKDTRVKRVMDALNNDFFCPNEPELFKTLFQNLMYDDYYMVIADLASYIDVQDKATKDYANQKLWIKKAIMNVARSGKFSADRTIKEYAKDVWNVEPTL